MIDCSWIKIYDAPAGGEILNPNRLHAGDTVYLDITELPSGYDFIQWQDNNGNKLQLEQDPQGRYIFNVGCGLSIVGLVREKNNTCEINISVYPADVSGLYAEFTPQGTMPSCCKYGLIEATSDNCCYEFDRWSDVTENDSENPIRNVCILSGNVANYQAQFRKKKYNVEVIPDSSDGIVEVWKGGQNSYVSGQTSINVECGEEFTIRTIANTYYYCAQLEDGNGGVYVTNTGQENPWDVTLTFDCETTPLFLKAVFFSNLPIQYGIVYNLNYEGGEVLDGGVIENGGEFTFMDANGMREGYNFLGWSTEPEAVTEEYAPNETITFDFGEDMTFYGVWSEIESFNVVYKGQPDDPDFEFLTESHLNGENFNLYNPENVEGFQFLGWQITTEDAEPTGGETILKGYYPMPGYNIIAHAVWANVTNTFYTVTYVANNNTLEEVIENGYQNGDTVVIKSPQDMSLNFVNHTFHQWRSQFDDWYNPGTELLIYNDIVLTASWNENPKYIIDYDINGGVGTAPTSQEVYSGNNVILATNDGFSKDNYTFWGWSTEQFASIPQYTGGQIVLNVENSMTLYAIWKRTAKYKVYYNKNREEGECSSSIEDNNEYNEGDVVTVLDCSCTTSDGCECYGWNTMSDGSGETYVGGSEFEIHENIVLFGMWDYCEVTFISSNPNGRIYVDGNAIENGTTIHIKEGTTFDVTPPLGYCFNGWLNEETCRFLDMCDEPSSYEYKLIPEAYADRLMTDFSDEITNLPNDDFINELENKSMHDPSHPFIKSNETGEIRQLVGICDEENYVIDCGMTMVAIFNKRNFIGSKGEDGEEYISYDETNYSNIYGYVDFIENGNFTIPSYQIVHINDVEYFYIITQAECNEIIGQ